MRGKTRVKITGMGPEYSLTEVSYIVSLAKTTVIFLKGHSGWSCHIGAIGMLGGLNEQ